MDRLCPHARRFALLWIAVFPAIASAASVAVPNIFVKANASLAKKGGISGGAGCQVLYLDSREDTVLPNGQMLDLRNFEAILTDAPDIIPWAESRPPFHWMDQKEYPYQPGRVLYQQKMGLRTFSFLVPTGSTDPLMLEWIREAQALFPNDVYYDDGLPGSRRPAFEKYAFSVLLSLEAGIPPVQVLESVAYSCVPFLVFDMPHFINYTIYFPYMVGKLRSETFAPQQLQTYMQNVHPDATFVMQNSLMLVQDFFYFRYAVPFRDRLLHFALRLCENAALPQPLRTDVFIAIYSAKGNFAQRRAARETWLMLLDGGVPNVHANGAPADPITTSHKFFINAVGAGDPGDPASSPLDDLIRAEAEAFGDLVFLDAVEEYPIGEMGRMALHWLANHTKASFVLKIDDDMYIRPYPLLRHLVKQQKATMYWGFFERSGEAVRDTSSAHFLTDDLFGHDGVFPPYARGAALALSLDLIRLIVHFDRLGSMRRLKVEDASYGYFLWQLVVMGVTSVTYADRYEAHFALDPKCCTEKTHPNNCWSPLGDATWIVHHVGPINVRCMFQTDMETGYYLPRLVQPTNERQCMATAAFSFLDETVGIPGGASPDPCSQYVAASPHPDFAAAYDPGRHVPLPSLCNCVHTPPPHPGQPLPGGPLYEGANGPRLNH